MHLPFMKYCLPENTLLVPIMVGHVDDKMAESYGKLLAKYFERDDVLFCISTDFCHWGSRFRFTPYDKSHGEIWQSIKALDEQGMKHIEQIDYRGFTDYIDNTKNTICGREPIRVFLQTIKNSSLANTAIKWVKYDQSKNITDANDSSVSYASSIIYL